MLVRAERADDQREAVAPDTVRLAVRAGGLHGDLLDIETEDIPRAELERGDGEDAAARADIEQAVAVLHQVLHGDQAELRGGVEAGAEGHAGVERDDRIVRLRPRSRATAGG